VLLEITLLAVDQAAEPLTDALLAAGALSVSVEDADAASAEESPLFGEPGFEPLRQAWARNRLRVLLTGDAEDGRRLVDTASREAGIAHHRTAPRHGAGSADRPRQRFVRPRHRIDLCRPGHRIARSVDI